MTIKEQFENFWKFYKIGNKFKEKDKADIYQVFLDGYGCAIINSDKSRTKENITKTNK